MTLSMLHVSHKISLQASILSTLGALICFGLLLATPDDDEKKLHLRIGYLLGFAGLSGVGMGPLLEHIILVDPSIIVTALIGTSVVFVSFSICAMLAERGKYLFLGGTLMTMLSTLMLLSLANLLFGSMLLFQANLYIGLLAMCGFVLYDTQLIIEKRRMGSKDFVTHSLDLFVDFIGIFRRLAIILTQKVILGNRYSCYLSVPLLWSVTEDCCANVTTFLYLLQEQESQRKRRN